MRTVGALGMSVGTSLAFEGESVTSILSSDTILFNLRTLIRNAHQAYEKDDRDAFKVDQIVADVKDDIVKLAKWINENRGTRPINMVVYAPSYDGLKYKFKKAELWEPKTEKQKAFVKLSDDVSAILVREYKTLIHEVNCQFPTFSGQGIVLTHHAVDLTLSNSVMRLYLLESYTAALKPYTQWYTKLTGGEELFNMPFNRLTIQIFGDRSTNFRSQSLQVKNLVKELAQQAKWTSATSYDRVKATINGLGHSPTKVGLQMML